MARAIWIWRNIIKIHFEIISMWKKGC